MNRTKIYLNGEYMRNNPGWGEEDAGWKTEIIDKLLKKNGITFNNAVEVGCGSGKILLELAKRNPGVKHFSGYDISPQAIAIAKTITDDRIQFYNENFLETVRQSSDLLLLIDVVEHMEDYYGFLSGIKQKAGKFVFHIPLDLSCRTLFKPHILLQQRDSVGHIQYFSREMVFWMLKDTGYTVLDWIYTKPLLDTTTQVSIKNKIKKMLRNFSFQLNKDLSATLWGGYSLMILAG
jgi:SAM-dependent methyltransferase